MRPVWRGCAPELCACSCGVRASNDYVHTQDYLRMRAITASPTTTLNKNHRLGAVIWKCHAQRTSECCFSKNSSAQLYGHTGHANGLFPVCVLTGSTIASARSVVSSRSSRASTFSDVASDSRLDALVSRGASFGTCVEVAAPSLLFCRCVVDAAAAEECFDRACSARTRFSDDRKSQ